MHELASFQSPRGTQLLTVRVVAEARSGWMVVEGLNEDGMQVRYAVKAKNLMPLQPSLF